MARITADDYAKLPEGREELIDGVIVPTPTPDPTHQVLVHMLLSAVCDHLSETWSDRVLLGPCDVRLDDYNVLAPDVLVFPEGTRATPPPWKIPLPILVMEVIDPATEARDRDIKLPLYRAGGVREEWIVDEDRKTIEVHDFGASSKTVFGAGDIATSAAVPGFSIDVARLFEI
ncbi:MAG: Uma2 family endonuclease [Planctomycetota bacterium]